jgi:pSer/pThr/pTyr-binding forkhead associated (FHA) protein
MNDTAQGQLAVHVLRRIDTACDNFEEAWRSGRQPRIEDYLPSFEVAECQQLIDSLQRLQQELILAKLPPTRSRPSTLACPVVDVDPAPEQSAPAMPSPADPDSTPGESGSLVQVTLRVIAGPHSGQQFTYTEYNTLFAGRLTKAQLRLENDLHFSRHHFRLEVNPPTCYLMDLSSRNGTFVNGERVTDCFLKDGDIISGGKTKLEVAVVDVSPASRAECIPPESAAALSGSKLPNPAPPEEEPSIQIPGYQIHEQLGEGDLGIVYRATRMAPGETCALKVITPEAQMDERAIQTFLREATILRQLQHPNIVKLLELGSSGQRLYLATEYVEAEDWTKLTENCSTEKRIQLACGLMSQILGALEYAHSRSFVHRDVKPGNVLITRNGGKLTAKLADLGLAKQYTTAGMSQVTRDGDVIGSLPFISPDQFLNSREARPTCDIYSAGATLYWMLSGHEPILLDDHPCKFLAILENPPVPLEKHLPQIPVALAQLVHRTLEKTPERRFASAAEMRRHLREFARP